MTVASSPARPSAPPPTARVGWRDVFAVREFRGLFVAQFGSFLGDQLAKIALAILVFHRSHSAFLGALTYAVTLLPALASGPLLGWLADRRPRREVMIGCDLGRAALIAPMLIPGMPTAVLLSLLFLAAFLDSPFAAARSALLPEVLEGEQYAVAQSLGSAMYQVSQVVGFGVGGALVAVLSARGALAVDVATFLVSALVVRLWSPRRPARDTTAVSSRWALVTDGAREVARRPELRRLLAITAASFGLIIATEGLAVSYAAQLGHGAVATGLLTAAVPVGSAVGVVAVVRLPESRRLLGLRVLGVVWALPLLVTALRPPVWATCALWAVAGALGGFQVLGNVLFVRHLRADNRGRVFAFAQSALVAVQGLGLLGAGLVARYTSPSTAVAVAGATGIVVCGFLSLRLGAANTLSTTVSSPVDDGRYDDVPPDPSAPAAAAPRAAVRTCTPARRASWTRPAAVVVVSVATILAVSLVVCLVPWTSVYDGQLSIPWWLLALVFIAVSFMPLHFQRGDSSIGIVVAQVPLLLGLFFASPESLLLAMVAGVGLRELRGASPVKFLANRAGASVEVLVALGVFRAVSPAHGLVDGRQLVAGGAAVVLAEVAGFLFVAAVRRIVQPDLRLRDLREPMAFAALISVTVASVGLLSVLALSANTAAGAILVVVGLAIAGGFRAFANLQERHAGLGRLYALQEQMGALVPRGESLFPVLRQTKALLVAADVALELPDAEGGVHLVRVDAGDREIEAHLPVSDLDRTSWSPPGGLSVSLRDGQRELGLLRVSQRLGKVRAFNQSDLHLLETLAAHVSDALQRGTLIERLHEAATHDNLTGLLTLGEFMSRLDQSLLRGGTHLITVLDVARLQDINDSLGHQAGDALLVQVANRLLGVLPADALVARAGGGEFAVAVADVRTFDAAALVEAMVAAVSGLLQVLDVTIDLRSKTGWLLTPYDGEDAATVVRRADLALAYAKANFQPVGRYHERMDVDGRRRLQLVNDLRQAIADGGLRVVYQPLVTPRDGRIVGAEALVRWTHPVLGELSPEEFVGVAEQSGMIGDLTDFVLDQALAQTRRWVDAGRDIHVAVNLSARCLTDMSLPGRVLDMLARNRLTPARLTLEVTETSVAEDPARALAVLERLRGVGVRLSIDDFGTGYSSLASLKHFPVQEVKLDRSFLVDLDVESDEEAASDLALLGAVVALGHSMKLEIVAEGVETPQAYRRLRDLGVDVLQGYFLGRPGPAQDLPGSAPMVSPATS